MILGSSPVPPSLFLCLCFHLNFPLLNEFPCSKFKKVAISKKNSVSYPIIYIGLIQARQYLKPIHNICYKSWFYFFRIFVIIIYIIVIVHWFGGHFYLFLSVQCPFISFVCWTRFILTLVFYCDFTSTKVIIELNGAVKNGLIFGLHFDNSILHSELKSK